MEQSKPNALLDHLAKKNTPGAAWQEYLKLRPAQAAEWLTGSPSLLQRMVGDYSMGGELATLLTTQLGADIWQQAQEGGTILSTLFAKRMKWRANHPDPSMTPYGSDMVSALATTLERGTLLRAIELAKQSVPPYQHATLAVVPTPDPEHKLAEAEALLALGYAEAALTLGRNDPSLHTPDDKGRTLGWLALHTPRGQRAWIEQGENLGAPVWIDQQGQQLVVATPWAEVLNKRGLYHEETKAWLRKNQGDDDPLFEQQLQGKAWRGALGRRAQWRTWTNGRGGNALHVMAQHHPASFLTSLGRVQANEPLLGGVDGTGYDMMAYLLLGMLAQAPEQNRSYWENARSHFMEVARKIEQSRVRQYPDARPKGVLRLLLDQQGTIPKIHEKPFENLGAEAKGWMRSHAGQVWEGMDRDAGLALARQPDVHENTRRLWTLALRHAIEEGFPAGAARETQVIVLVMSLGNGGGGGFWCTEQEASRILDGELSFPADVMDRLEHYLDKGADPVHELVKTRLRKFKLDQMIDQDESTPARPRM